MATALDTQLRDILAKSGLGAAIATLAKGDAGDEVEAVVGEEGKGDAEPKDESGGDNAGAVDDAAAKGEETGRVEDLAKGDDEGDGDESGEGEGDDDTDETSESEETDPTSSEEEASPGFEAMKLGGNGTEIDVTEFLRGMNTILRQTAASVADLSTSVKSLDSRTRRLEKATRGRSDEIAALRDATAKIGDVTAKIGPQIERLAKGTAAAFEGAAAVTLMAAGTHATSRVPATPAVSSAPAAGFTTQQLMKGVAEGVLKYAEVLNYEKTCKTHAQGIFSDDDARNREIIAKLTPG